MLRIKERLICLKELSIIHGFPKMNRRRAKAIARYITIKWAISTQTTVAEKAKEVLAEYEAIQKYENENIPNNPRRDIQKQELIALSKGD
jgi:hypothetical protein